MPPHEVFEVPRLQPHEVGAWVDDWLRQPGGNVPLADGLQLAPRRWEAPQRVPVHSLRQACGPEPEMEYHEPVER
ncbi:hypothetical protein GO986_13890 [Deinococcus sp. HMF7620]|uniref:Uncharacterized protein n=1 Tax=Deinococcus arboris TaxID=2682977 RepID=A0A7C9HZP7_9DEIO|nr:hypothetical protein [Deinococcus arboris]MVN87848.1 hypothetical protein [Deinococcus arboris]